MPGIERTFKSLEKEGTDFYVLTNDASRSPEELSGYFTSRGVAQITPDKIISSGMLARDYLKLKVKKGVVAYLGTDKSAHYIESAGLHTLPISQLNLREVEEVSALVLLDDEGFDWNHDVNKVVNLLRKRTIPVIVANTDTAYPVSKEEVAVAIGGLADMVEAIVGKRFIRFGKPDAQMFMFAYELILRRNPTTRDRILMVGDTLATDIMGGNKFGLDTALVLSGNTLPDQALTLIRSTGIIPTHICESAVVNA
ncbi:MAG: HAD-IIA family hydrolase [Cytophagales bacterium]|nr:HAD-IIA family hydrolase [Cytophagales bacterium]